MDVLIRTAEPDDLDRLSEALGPEHHAYFTDRLCLQKNGLGEIRLAFGGHAPVGTVCISWNLADEPEVRRYLPGVPMICHLYVAPRSRRSGIGLALVRDAEQRLRERGHARVLLGVDKSNRVARDLYRRLGYVQPVEPELSDMRATPEPGQREHAVGEAYDIFVADLHRPAPS